MRVLLTRPVRESEATAKRLAARGHEAIIAPVMRIVATGATLPRTSFEAVVVTSAHALELAVNLHELSHGKRLHCVGSRAADAARAHGGFSLCAVARDANALCAQILAQATPRSHFLYLAGAERKPVLEEALRAAGHNVETVVVYEARAETALPGEAIAALRDGAIDAALHFSRRSAALFLDLARAGGVADALAGMAHVCISQDAAAPILAAGLSARIAASPDAEAIFDVLENPPPAR